jgi:hypothetical protein
VLYLFIENYEYRFIQITESDSELEGPESRGKQPRLINKDFNKN